MNCREFQDFLIDNGPRSTGNGDSPFAQHRASCAECARFAARFAAVDELLVAPASADPKPHPGFSHRVIASLPAPANALTWASLRLLPVTTALALALLGWCWVATPAPDDLWSQADQDDVFAWVLEEEVSFTGDSESQ